MRKVTIISESMQVTKTFETEATTLGELKHELAEKGISYSDDSVFKEGKTKTILSSDASVLPSNIPWKGGITNDLVFMITAPQKKIKSGKMDRKEAYAKIKELGLQDAVQKKTGRNFTQCGTAVLIEIIENAEKKTAKKSAKKEGAPVAKEKNAATAKDVIAVAVELIHEMEEAGAISEGNAQNLIGILQGKDPLPVEEPEDFDDMFNNW